MIFWQAELNEEEAEHATDEILDEMYERLKDFWKKLKDELLYA